MCHSHPHAPYVIDGRPSRLLVTFNIVKEAAQGVQRLVIGWDDELEGLNDE